eukprot:TRINITY_DN464_c0_g1_i2.p1 TRINITY_DN464_c0_g1~~TRINITY_DN464_c0_g1_i2.p1  ORF type:complete len:107 (-),score=27.12 TRINITY_DN464_c0_g1_i2:124-444(-)
MGGNVIIVNNLTEYRTHLNSGKLVIVDFFAVWCPPCKRISPVFETLSIEHPDVVFLKVDVDQARDVATNEGISAMPTFFAYKGGKKVDEVVGASEPGLRQMISKHK